MARYHLPGSNEAIFYRQGRKRHLEELLAGEGLDSIGALLRTRPHRALTLLVQYGVDRNGGGPPGASIVAPMISEAEADALVDQASEAGTTDGDLIEALGREYTGAQKKADGDASAASGPAPTTTPTLP